MTASLGEPSSHWHSIRPWSPRFLLTVREITSVSTTFVLSSTCSSDGTDTSLASLGITPGSASDDEDSPENALPGLTSSRSYLLSDALDALGRGRGLSVNVNGANWKRVLMRPNDKGDEAILVIYGLMPGRQYDVEIGIVFGDGEEVLHSRMVTQPQPGQSVNEEVGNNSVDSITPSINTVPTLSPSTSSTTQSPHILSLTHDEYASQLHSQLSHIDNERNALLAELKSARKEAHKGDAAKRSEIEALKRASEKHAAADMRGRQKIRALQEAVKQAAAAAREAEEDAREVEKTLPEAIQRAEEVAKTHAGVLKEAERTKEEAEESIRADKKRTSDLRAELGTLTARLEKLQAKRERLSKESLPGLEEELARLVRQVELVERDVGAFEVIDNGPVGFDLGMRTYSQTTTPFGSPSATVVRHHSLQSSQVTAGGMNGTNSKGPFGFNPNLNGPLPPSQLPPPPPSSSSSSSSSTIANTTSNGSLPNRAPPFDPGLGYNTRLGPAFQLQTQTQTQTPIPPPMGSLNGNNGARRAPTMPLTHPHTQPYPHPHAHPHTLAQMNNPLSQMTNPLSHTQSQSLDVGYNGGGGGFYPGPGQGQGQGPNTTGPASVIGRRPVSPGPSRQASLPVNMPSYSNGR